MTPVRRALLYVVAVAVLGGSLALAQATRVWAGWNDSVAVGSPALGARTVLPPSSVTCTGGALLGSLTYTWPGRDPLYTYRAQLVDSTGAVIRTDLVPESGRSSYSVTYAVGDVPLGDFTVRVTSFLTASPGWGSAGAASAGGSKTLLTLGLTTACKP